MNTETENLKEVKIKMETQRIYTNDLERERLRQASYAKTQNRLSLNRHRLRRAKVRQLAVIALIASENKDQTIYRECRTRMAELEESMPTSQPLAKFVDVVDSRRLTRAQRFAFASNRMLDEHILDHTEQVHTFPQSEDRAMDAANADKLV